MNKTTNQTGKTIIVDRVIQLNGGNSVAVLPNQGSVALPVNTSTYTCSVSGILDVTKYRDAEISVNVFRNGHPMYIGDISGSIVKITDALGNTSTHELTDLAPIRIGIGSVYYNNSVFNLEWTCVVDGDIRTSRTEFRLSYGTATEYAYAKARKESDLLVETVVWSTEKGEPVGDKVVLWSRESSDYVFASGDYINWRYFKLEEPEEEREPEPEFLGYAPQNPQPERLGDWYLGADGNIMEYIGDDSEGNPVFEPSDNPSAKQVFTCLPYISENNFSSGNSVAWMNIIAASKAFIDNLIVNDANIGKVSIDKLETSEDESGNRITITNKYIRSYGKDGSVSWELLNNGKASFVNAEIRGNVTASSVDAPNVLETQFASSGASADKVFPKVIARGIDLAGSIGGSGLRPASVKVDGIQYTHGCAVSDEDVNSSLDYQYTFNANVGWRSMSWRHKVSELALGQHGNAEGVTVHSTLNIGADELVYLELVKTGGDKATDISVCVYDAQDETHTVRYIYDKGTATVGLWVRGSEYVDILSRNRYLLGRKTLKYTLKVYKQKTNSRMCIGMTPFIYPGEHTGSVNEDEYTTLQTFTAPVGCRCIDVQAYVSEGGFRVKGATFISGTLYAVEEGRTYEVQRHNWRLVERTDSEGEVYYSKQTVTTSINALNIAFQPSTSTEAQTFLTDGSRSILLTGDGALWQHDIESSASTLVSGRQIVSYLESLRLAEGRFYDLSGATVVLGSEVLHPTRLILGTGSVQFVTVSDVRSVRESDVFSDAALSFTVLASQNAVKVASIVPMSETSSVGTQENPMYEVHGRWVWGAVFN